MKKLTLITFVLIFCYVTAYAQSCLPEGITFETQAQIDSFQIIHPNCTEIEGDVEISGNDITNLNGLSLLTSIGGNLVIEINDILPSMTGLDNVTSIGGFISIVDNDSLTSLTGLENITSIMGGDLHIGNNGALTSLTGLENVTTIGGVFGISNNNVLTSLTSLENMSSIGGDLWISFNDALTSLSGLENIESNSIEHLTISYNQNLSTCEVKSVCDYLSNQGLAYIKENAPGCNSQKEVEEACGLSIDDLDISTHLTIFPNPANQELNISIDNHIIGEVKIYTLTGQQMMQDKPSNGTIDISHLQPGMYIVDVTIENTRIMQKLLVQR